MILYDLPTECDMDISDVASDVTGSSGGDFKLLYLGMQSDSARETKPIVISVLDCIILEKITLGEKRAGSFSLGV